MSVEMTRALNNTRQFMEVFQIVSTSNTTEHGDIVIPTFVLIFCLCFLLAIRTLPEAHV